MLILSIPSFFFLPFSKYFWCVFYSRVVLDLLTNFFLHLLILEIAHLWPKFCYDSLSFEEEFLNQSFGFGLFFPFVLVCSSAGASSSGGLQRERARNCKAWRAARGAAAAAGTRCDQRAAVRISGGVHLLEAAIDRRTRGTSCSAFFFF